MGGQLIRAMILLPGSTLVVIPGLIVLATGWNMAPPYGTRFWAALALFAVGGQLATWTIVLFWRIGRGTPAPWAPPKNFVVRGPYRHTRNPMISAVVMMMLAEALCFGSWPLALWAAAFFAVNTIYFAAFEEKKLEHRFGADYRRYKQNVPRWLPRLSGWDLPRPGPARGDGGNDVGNDVGGDGSGADG